jgi:aryl sulfotransferase
MPGLIRGPLRHVHSRVYDSRRWDGWKPRADDIVVATYGKCGTTWTQRIVGMLVFASADPFSINDVSPWPDAGGALNAEEVWGRADAQAHRRFFKTHLPYDALPIYEGVKTIHVGRDGRDAALSFHNHLASFTPEMVARFSAANIADPKFGTPFPEPPADPADYFHAWLTDPDENGQGDGAASYFHVEPSYWSVRGDANLLLVHYADLKADRGGEMRRIADFLDIRIDEALWPSLVEAAGFEVMREQGDTLAPMFRTAFQDGARSFFNRGVNGRWRDVFRPQDLAAYEQVVAATLPPDLAAWLEYGRAALNA